MKDAFLLLLCHTLLILGCSSESSTIPKTESDILNNLLKDSPASIVQISDLSPDTLYADKNHVMGDSRIDSLSPSARLGRITGLVKIGDTLYVADGQQNCIWAINKQGKIFRKIGRSGSGPGEFGDLNGLFNNNDHIFTGDVTNARIQIFDFNFNIQNTFNHVIHGSGLSGNKSLSVTDSLLYLSTGASNNAAQLITAYQAVIPFDSLDSFHPRLIPQGMQPAAYNDYGIDTNSQGDVAVSYAGLPYIFIYDEDRQLQHVVYVKFPENELPDNPPVKPIDKSARTVSEAIGVTGLIGRPTLTDDGSLYFSHGSKLYCIRYIMNENKYQAEWIKFFTYADPGIREDRSNGINISNFHIDEDENKIYFGSIFEEYIYRFSL